MKKTLERLTQLEAGCDARIARHKRAIARLEKCRVAVQKTIGARLELGEGTTDAVADFCRQYDEGFLRPGLYKFLKDIYQKLCGKEGQFFKIGWEFGVYHGPRTAQDRTGFYMDKSIGDRHFAIHLPSVYCDHDYRSGTAHDLLLFDKWNHWLPGISEMCIGDEEMLRWFEEHGGYSLRFFEMATMLGRADPPTNESLRKIRDDWLEGKKRRFAQSDDRVRAAAEIVGEGKKYGFDTSFVNQYFLAV